MDKSPDNSLYSTTMHWYAIADIHTATVKPPLKSLCLFFVLRFWFVGYFDEDYKAIIAETKRWKFPINEHIARTGFYAPIDTTFCEGMYND